MEDALTNNFSELSNVKNSPLDVLFPLANSTIGEAEIATILKKCDLDGNQMITRREMAKLFMANKDWLAEPFENRIQNVKRKLNL